MHITIVGCGTLGSCLSFWIHLNNMDNKDVDEVTLVDHDSVSEKNLPYLFRSDREFLGKPKVVVLKSILLGYNPNFKINTVFSKFPIRRNAKQGTHIYKTYIVDCRDTKDSDDRAKFKINFDGAHGLIHFNPRTRRSNKETEYTMSDSKATAWLLSGIFYNMIKDRQHYEIGEEELYAIHTHSGGGIDFTRSNVSEGIHPG